MWKYTSRDEDCISLHDNFLSKILICNDDIALFFDDGFDILNTHPLNDTGKAKHTTTSQVFLKNAKFIGGKVHNSKILEHWNMSAGDFLTLINLPYIFEVYSFLLDTSVRAVKFTLNGGLTYKEKGFISEFADISFRCTDYLFCWSDYSNDAWFENWA